VGLGFWFPENHPFTLSTKHENRVLLMDLRLGGDVSVDSSLLLRKLKALSESSHFDLFTNYNSWTQQDLTRVKHLLQTAYPVIQNLDSQDLYSRPRNGSWDKWKD
jgi:hypothetical protein